MKKLILLRRLAQTVSFVLFLHLLCFFPYSLSRLATPASFIFQADPFLIFVTSISERVFLSGMAFALLSCVLAAVLGRFFCGWVCPLGAMLDFSRALNPKRFIPRIKAPVLLKRTKFIVLSFILLMAFFGAQLAWVLDPLVIAARFVSLNLIPLLINSLNGIFVLFIRGFGLYGWVYDLYRAIKESFLGINTYYFAHSLWVFFFTLLLIGSSIVIARFWCRMFCPLGALLGAASFRSLLRRKVGSSCNNCGTCALRCRMEAIDKAGLVYDSKECVLCMDCVYDCPQKAVRFTFGDKKKKPVAECGNDHKISRRQFLLLITGGLLSLGFRKDPRKGLEQRTVIRPPAALPEGEFNDRCIRCGNCMKVCITNGLQPCLFESGVSGIWTPRLVPEIGYCEYKCVLCTRVCPTGAIRPLTEEEKSGVKIGVAAIDRSICLPWARNEECLVCEEHCPVASKAIKLRKGDGSGIYKPEVDTELCVGCGICQNKCPVAPLKAIRVRPL